jgi:glycosyltransferase involved in cell wall biosynthesis
MKAKNALWVDHYSFSKSGGAGVIAQRMMQWQQDEGYESHLITTISDSIGQNPIQRPTLLLSALFDFFVVRRKQKNTPLFSLFRRKNLVNRFLQTSPQKVIHLHWTPGVLSNFELSQILNLNSATVWTLHDMWPLTGGCHHNDGCLKYLDDCSNCPQVRVMFQSKVEKEFARKKNEIESSKNLAVISPSKWLERIARESAVFKRAHLRVIRNPVKADFFVVPEDRKSSTLGEALRVVFVATDLADRNKNLEDVIKVIERINQLSTDISREIHLTTVGANAPSKDKKWQNNLGVISNSRKLADVLSDMDVLISFSTAENLPNVIGEAMASGLVVVARNVGGISELVQDGVTGLLVNSEEELIDALSQLITDRRQLKLFSKTSMDWAKQNLSEAVIMKEYEALYLELLQNQESGSHEN